MGDKLKIYENCPCVCPVIYNDFNSFCHNRDAGLCAEAIIQNIHLARDHMLKKQGCASMYCIKEERYREMNLSTEDIDRKILSRLYEEKEKEKFREFCEKEHPGFSSTNDIMYCKAMMYNLRQVYVFAKLCLEVGIDHKIEMLSSDTEYGKTSALYIRSIIRGSIEDIEIVMKGLLHVVENVTGTLSDIEVEKYMPKKQYIKILRMEKYLIRSLRVLKNMTKQLRRRRIGFPYVSKITDKIDNIILT